ncbi:MAG: hypothetical protein IPK19_30800 [Chloroflexi bacterium]|nr:hypothetical protein [Chloroflexota bacterium]
MLFQHETKRLLAVLLAILGLLALSAAYWAVDGPDSLLRRPDNPRLVESAAAIRRGAIYDRNELELVTSAPASANVGASMVRQSHLEAAYSAVGYYSLRYGASGVELAYDSHLSGADRSPTLQEAFEIRMLHRPAEGGDIRLTLDANIQQRLADRLAGLTGAGVVIDVPSGEILAAVSLPTYNPNTLDLEWDQLVEAPGDPFFNRVVQGRYQPGSALQTPMIAAASLVDYAFDRTFEGGTLPYVLEQVTSECAVRLPEGALTLQQAYIFACPSPFAAFAEEIGAAVVGATLETFHVEDYPALPGFAPAIENETAPTPTPESTEQAEAPSIVASALGQGDIVVSPLMMALITAGIVNDGNVPQPTLLDATRSSSGGLPGDWQEPVATEPTFPIATANTARLLQDFMRDAVANGAAQNAGRPEIDIGGHAALAYAGDESHVWFIGFTTLRQNRAVAIAIVVENNADPGLAADIGGDVLATAHDLLMP